MTSPNGSIGSEVLWASGRLRVFGEVECSEKICTEEPKDHISSRPLAYSVDAVPHERKDVCIQCKPLIQWHWTMSGLSLDLQKDGVIEACAS